MANEVEIHVTWHDDGDKALSDIKSSAKKSGAEAGTTFSGSFTGAVKGAKPAFKQTGDEVGRTIKEGIEKTPAARLKTAAENPIDEAWRRKIQSSIKAMATSALNVPVTPDTELFRRDLEASLKKAAGLAKTKIPVDPDDAGKFRAQVESLVARTEAAVKVRVPVEADQSTIKKATDDVEKATEKVAKRANAQFEGLKFAAWFAGLPAAAAVGTAAVGVTLAALPILFAGVAGAALKGNAQVENSYASLKNHVVTDTQQMAGVMQGPALKASDALGKSFDRLKPQVQSAMTESADLVDDLVGSVTDFAEEAMPGMVTSIKAAEAPVKGLRSLTGQVGAGFTDMTSNMAEGSDEAGASLKTLGGILRDAEGFLGSFTANLAKGSTGVLPQFRSTLAQVEDTVLTLSSNGMPALQGTTNGFLSVVSGGIGILNAGAHALGSWAAPVGALGGQLLATNGLAKLFGTSLGETGFGVGAFAKTVQDGERQISPFRAALNQAGQEGTSKFKAGLNALVSNGINPLGIALVGGSMLLAEFGAAQQKAAQASAEHKENVRQLTAALRADGGVYGQHSDAVNVEALAAKNASNNLAAFGVSLETAKLAIQGNTGAMSILTDKSNSAIDSIGQQAGLSSTQVAGLKKVNAELLQNGGSYDSVKDKIKAYTSETVAAGKAGSVQTDALTEAQRKYLDATFNASGAVGDQIKAQRQAYEAYLLAESALTGLSRAQVENRDATIKATQAIYDQQNAQLGLRGAQLNTKAALEEYHKVSKDGKATEDQKAAALLRVEQAFAAQEKAAYDAAFANAAGKTPAEQTAAAFAAANAETVKLANSMAGPLPISVDQTIGKFTVAQAKAAGLTVAIDGTGNAVYRLPNGKDIRINAETGQAKAALAEIKRAQDALYNKTVTHTIINRVVDLRTSGGAYQPSLTGRPAYGASGGHVGSLPTKEFPAYSDGGSIIDALAGGMFQGPGTGTSDSLLARVSTDEFIVKATAAKKNRTLLEMINNDQLQSFAGGGMVQAEDGSWVPSSFYGPAPKGPHAKYTASGFAKLTAQAKSLGINSLDADDQNQLRTYGGWTDALTAAPVPAQRAAVRRIARSAADAGGRVVLEFQGGGTPLEDLLMEVIRKHVRVRGGDVQAVFGP